MTTSGTVGATVIDTMTLIEHMFRRCGKMPSTVSSEQQIAAKESLFFLLTDMVNQGLSLWCIKKTVIPVVAGKAVYTLPPGTSDILSVLLRTYTELTPDSTANSASAVTQTFTDATSPTNAQIVFSAAGNPALVVESSNDSFATSIIEATFPNQLPTLAAGNAISVDIENPTPSTEWRVRDTTGTILAGATLTLSNTPSEIPCSSLNRDMYDNLPNKTFQSSRPLQYWFDKQIEPQIVVWPISNTDAAQLVLRAQRQIEDVGSLSYQIEVPQRWYEYILFTGACRVAVELPAAELPSGRLEYLEQKAEFHRNQCADGETDGAPFTIQPNLRGYTR